MAAAAMVFAGSTPSATGGFVGNEWWRVPTNKHVVALTFDCGSNDAGVAKILAALAERHAAATFFLSGRWAEVHPGPAKRIARAYPVGNHTYSHPHLTRLSDTAVRLEIDRGASVIQSVTGAVTKPLFRFPYGDRDARTTRLAGDLGYGSVAWTVDTLGWKGRSAGGTRAVVSRVLAGLRPGAIVLMHVGAATDRSTLDADALPAVLRAVAARGYGFTTLTDYTSATVRSVDDANADRFRASTAWGHSSWNPQHYGSGYHFAKPSTIADAARFRLRVPTAASYLVYARWPASSEYGRSAPFGIATAGGLRWVRVDQRHDGGRWVYLGSYRLRAGDRDVVQLSRRTGSSGLVIADAVRIVKRP